MISVIVYGRNDHYGYNLHKRAAISLNCLSEVLTPEDELIFIDYNSADELPTFPEAIADTLTPRARHLLRIFRVRPKIHARYAASTNLPVVEPIARNVGIRRSNPDNRWILSTNADDVLVLRHATDLASLVGDLPAGFYHTPRFEVPEGLWESFDRADPQSIISDLRRQGRAARLNEVVYGQEVSLFDGPGDFQLVERAALLEIDGLDERMLRGWHVDSNIAKRLSLRYGAAKSLLDQVYCYHCDHMRHVTIAHTFDFASNESDRFVDDVVRPDLPEQRHSWGCAEDGIEEIRLSEGSAHRYRGAVGSLVSPLEDDFIETYYTPADFDRRDYDPQRILLFFGDLLNAMPRDLRLAWCGRRLEMFELVQNLWAELGFSFPISVHHSVAPCLGSAAGGFVESQDPCQWLATADLFCFDFGRADRQMGTASTLAPEIEREGLNLVESVFLAAVAHEQARRAASLTAVPRRFVGIDSIHNRSEELFATHVATLRTPFSTHLRHGILRTLADENETDVTARAVIGNSLGRVHPISREEFRFAQRVFEPFAMDATVAKEDQVWAASHAALGEAFISATKNPWNEEPPPAEVVRAIAGLEAIRPSTELAAKLGITVCQRLPMQSRERPLSRLAASEDWDNPSWSAFAEHYVTDAGARAASRRDAALWEQIHLLYGLNRAGSNIGSARVLVVSTMPDAAVAALSRLAGAVEVFALSAGPADSAAAAREFWCDQARYNPEKLKILEERTAPQHLDAEGYDAVIFPHGSIFSAGWDGAVAWMQSSQRLLKPNGVLAFKAEIAAEPRPHPDFLDARALSEDGLAAQLGRLTAFRVDGGFDPHLTRTTLDMIQPEEGPTAGHRYFVWRQNGRVIIPSYWFANKGQAMSGTGWAELSHWIKARWGGELLSELQVGEAGRRCDDGSIESLRDRVGYLFFGPYRALPDGKYRIVATFDRSRIRRRDIGRATLEAVAEGAIIAQTGLDRAAWRAGVAELDFEIRSEGEPRGNSVLEVRLHSQGRLSLRVESVCLALRDAIGDRDFRAHLPMTASQNTSRDRVSGANGSNDLAVTQTEFAETRLASMTAGDAGRPLSGLATFDDWDDLAWRGFIDPGSSHENRDLEQWSRTHVLYGLDRCNKLTLSARVLVAATMPDEIVGRLSEYVGRVDVLDIPRQSSRIGSEARLFWTNGGLYARDRVNVLDPSTGMHDLGQGAYDAIVFPHSSLLLIGTLGVARLLASADRALGPGGVIVFKAEILTGTTPDPGYLDESIFEPDGLLAHIEAHTGLAVVDGPHGRVGDQAPAGGLAIERHGRPATPGMCFLRKRHDTAPGAWKLVEQWLLRRLLGEQIEHLELGPAGRREAGGIAASGLARGTVFYGPYLSLPAGRYEAVVTMAQASPMRGQLVLDVLANGRSLSSQKIDLSRDRRSTVALPFAVPPSPGEGQERIEIRARRNQGEIKFTSCRLNLLAEA